MTRCKRLAMLLVTLFGAAPQSIVAQASGAERDLASVRRLAVRIDGVDSALIVFGVDTAKLRESIEAKLASSGLSVPDSAATEFADRFSVEVSILRAVSPASQPGGLVVVRVERLGAEPTRAPRLIWKSPGASARVPSYRLLAELVDTLTDSAVANFLAAWQGSRRALKSSP